VPDASRPERRRPDEAAGVKGLRIACDSFVALPARTVSGNTIFAKNSDRPAGECQPLKQIAAADWPAGDRVRCQYIEIDQVPHTYAVLGAAPYWLWGFEHGLNERGVAVGNHTIFTKDPVDDVGLQGMDLVRLALERGGSAAEAVEVVTSLIETYGQGGSGYLDTHWPYNNSFLIADAHRAFLLEASARHWAVREVRGTGSASNHTVIGSDWNRLSADCAEHAREQGWWDGQGRFDFAAAYRDLSLVPAVISSGRFARTCQAAKQPVDLGTVKRLLRDHYDSGTVYRPAHTPDEERYYSVCMHADPVGTTTASMAAQLRGPDSVPLYWAALGNPCVGPFLPLFPSGKVPAELLQGRETAETGGAWWRFHELVTLVEEAPARRAGTVRAFWDEWESEQAERARSLRSRFGDASANGGVPQAATSFMEEMWSQAVTALDEILDRARRL